MYTRSNEVGKQYSTCIIFISFIFILFFSIWNVTHVYGQKKKSVYFWLLKQCNQEVFTKTFEYPFLAILNDHLKERYKEYSTLEEKKSFIHYYWKEINPNPLLDENEYLEDFVKRCHYVEEHFSQAEPPYFDDRGTYYLKYGEPTTRYRQEPQTRFVDFFRQEVLLKDGSSIQVKKFLASRISKGIESKKFLPITYSIRGNETWVYQYTQGGREEELVLHFVDQGDVYREVASLEDMIIHPRKKKILDFYWADLLKERVTAVQSQSMFRSYEDILAFEEEIRSVGAKGDYYAVYSSGLDMEAPHKKFIDFNNDLTVTLINKKQDAPPKIFQPDKAVQDLFFHYDIVQFRGSDGETTLDVNYFTPLSENFSDENRTFKSETISLYYSSLFEDEMLERVMQSSTESTYDLEKLSKLELPYLIGNMHMSLLPRPGRVSLQVLDKETRRRGFVKRNMQLRDFSTPELCLSDIQFCQLVEDLLYSHFVPVRNISGLSVIPYPYENIKKSEQLFCYFEIYNIKTGGIQSQYEISIEVATAQHQAGLLEKAVRVFRKSPENSISINHIRDVVENDSQELIGIDFSNLIKGNYTLTIKVKGIDDQSISSEVTRNLMIQD